VQCELADSIGTVKSKALVALAKRKPQGASHAIGRDCSHCLFSCRARHQLVRFR
jgi:hypothetical protein